MNSLNCLAWPLLLVSAAGALRTCVDVQETMMACLMSSSINITFPFGEQEIARMCWDMKVKMECVDEAKGTCPQLPIFSDDGVVSSLREMEKQMGIHCKGVDEPMVSDQAAQDTCQPDVAMSHCSEIIKTTQGDREAKCRLWNDFLECLEQVEADCGGQFEKYDFDISRTIEYSRIAVEEECPDKGECDKVREEAERSCADYLTDGGENYCSHLEMFMDCLHRKLTACPDPELLTVVVNQFRHHCPPPGKRECPDDPNAAATACSAILHEDFFEDMQSYCQITARYLQCAEDLMDRCKDDPRFNDAYFVGIDTQRVTVASIC